MSNEAQVIQRLLQFRRIAIVGLSDDPSRPSYEIAAYLLKNGYEIIPVNPNCKQVLARKSVATLKEVAGQFELVNVFRRSEFCQALVGEAIAAGARGIWLQLGIRNDTAKTIAGEAGVDFVQNRCIKIEHQILP